ncbi:MAG: hypothetical protein ACK44N_03595, partial [Bacteroidota bacterium]
VKKAIKINSNKLLTLTESNKLVIFQIDLLSINYEVLHDNIADFDFCNNNLWVLYLDGKVRLKNKLYDKAYDIKNFGDTSSTPILIRGSKKENNIIVGYKNGLVLKYYLNSHKIDTIFLFAEKVNNLISINDENYWLGISDDFSVKIKNCYNNIEKSNFLLDYCTDVAIFQNEIWISSWDGAITIVNIELKEVYSLKTKTDKVIYFEKISRWQAALGFDNGKVSIFNRSTGEIQNIINANSRISSISYDNNNEVLLVGTDEGDLYTYSFKLDLVIDTTSFNEEIVTVKVNSIEGKFLVTTFSHVYYLDYNMKIIDMIEVQSPWFTTSKGKSYYVACKGGFVKTDPNSKMLLFDSLEYSRRNELIIDVTNFEWDKFIWTITYEGNLFKVYKDSSIFIMNIGEVGVTNIYGSKSDSCIYIITASNRIYRYS